MALIPTTNVSMRDLQQEYGGSASNVSVDSYYRNLNNAALVDNSVSVPYNPINYLQTSQSGNTGYSRYVKILFDATTLAYVPNTTITRIWNYGPSLVNITRESVNDPGTNPPAPGSFYGQVGAYFYFVPDTNYPYYGAPSIHSVFIKQIRTPIEYYGSYILFENWYGMYASLASAASTQPVNQTVPTSGQISLGQFRGQQNP